MLLTKVSPSPKRYVRQWLTFMGKPLHERRAIMRAQRLIHHQNRYSLKEQVAQRDGRCCARCGSTQNLVLDHVLPVSKGGLTVLRNLQLLCRKHDREKGTQIIDYRPYRRMMK